MFKMQAEKNLVFHVPKFLTCFSIGANGSCGGRCARRTIYQSINFFFNPFLESYFTGSLKTKQFGVYFCSPIITKKNKII